jgi:hypothetical protein
MYALTWFLILTLSALPEDTPFPFFFFSFPKCSRTNGVVKPYMDDITYLHPNIDIFTQKLTISSTRTPHVLCLFVDFCTNLTFFPPQKMEPGGTGGRLVIDEPVEFEK